MLIQPAVASPTIFLLLLCSSTTAFLTPSTATQLLQTGTSRTSGCRSDNLVGFAGSLLHKEGKANNFKRRLSTPIIRAMAKDNAPSDPEEELAKQRQLYQYVYDMRPEGVPMLKGPKSLDFSHALEPASYPLFVSKGHELPSFRWFLLLIGAVTTDVPVLSTALTTANLGLKWLFLLLRKIPTYIGIILGLNKDLSTASRAVRVQAHTQAAFLRAALDWLHMRKQIEWPDSGVDDDNDATTADSLNDYNNQFKVALPVSAMDFVQDRTFARYRLSGPNPTIITRVLTDHEDWNNILQIFPALNDPKYGFLFARVHDAWQAGELLMTDLRAIEFLKPGVIGVRPGQQKYLIPATALFSVCKLPEGTRQTDGEKEYYDPIEVLCIQLDTPKKGKPAPPIFYPDDPGDSYEWQLAKSLYTSSDGSYHETISHLGNTHLVVEAFIGATYRQLPSTHDLHKLLKPHFEGTPFINWGASALLLAETGQVAQLISPSMESALPFISESVLKKLDSDFSFPVEIASRHMTVKEYPYVYPYRDDAQLHWDAITEFVTEYLQIVYGSTSEEQVKNMNNDKYLLNWVKELQQEGKVGWLTKEWSADVTHNNFQLLVTVVSSLIHKGSVEHAAVNFPQKDIMAYAPAYPLAAFAPAPTKNMPRAVLREYLKVLPNLKISAIQKTLGQLLGGVYYTRLGEYRKGQLDARFTPLVKKWDKQRKEIKRTIEERNTLLQQRLTNDFATRLHRLEPDVIDKFAEISCYNTLLPENIPQSINI